MPQHADAATFRYRRHTFEIERPHFIADGVRDVVGDGFHCVMEGHRLDPSLEYSTIIAATKLIGHLATDLPNALTMQRFVPESVVKLAGP